MAVEGVRDTACSITAGDMARWLSVDLKTIHNWVRRGFLAGRRTAGGHRRFYRAEVVRFLRDAGRAVPGELTHATARVAIVGQVGLRGAPLAAKLGADHLMIEHLTNPFQALLQVAAGNYEILVVGLGPGSHPVLDDFVRALHEDALTRGVVAVGLSESASMRERFVRLGGDAAVADEQSLVRTVLWLTGAGPRPAELVGSVPAPKLRRAGNQLRPPSRASLPLRHTR
ncbi:MAG: helix-turn-helix domain-containing protein [Polyangiaceae bacterium]|nr:helix-turn-helix domain-containing protein [Polyangiaceae bacterium]